MYALKAAKNLQRCVQVEWEDGMLAKFSHVWLRDNTLRRPSLVHLDLNTKPEGIKCRKDALEVRWPPFLASSYTSTFLRDNALYTPTPIDKKVASTSASSNNYGGAAVEDPLGGNLLALVDARFPVDEQCVMGKCFWGEPAQEPGTIWPHLDRVPPFCTVDTLNGAAKLCFVETQKALDQLRECHPREFNFLANCVLEYKEGPFAATHPIIRTDNQGAVFNNATRSCAITVESLDDLYRSMQKFGRICAENMQELQLLPGQRLLFNNHRGMLGVPAQSGRSLMLRCLSFSP